jgi:BASS family bile acid:Na+ symporter
VYLLKRPGLLLRSLLSVLVIMPIVAVVMATMFDARQAAEVALVALAISPVPPLLPRRELGAGGQQSYGLALMVMLALLSIVVVPAMTELLQRVFDRPLAAAPGAVARVILTMAILPLLAGVVTRAVLPARADRIETSASRVGKVLLVLASVALLAGTWRAIGAAVGGGSVIEMTAFVVIGLAVGHVLGGPEPEHSVVLALSTACRHPVIALSIAAANYPGVEFLGTLLLYLIVNAIAGIAYVRLRRSVRTADAV